MIVATRAGQLTSKLPSAKGMLDYGALKVSERPGVASNLLLETK